MIVAQIDRDYLYDGRIITTRRVGFKWSIADEKLKDYFGDTDPESTKVRWRVLDDDRDVYYGGWLLNDDECRIQGFVVAWAEHDAGAIHIQVKTKAEWVYEIG